MGHKESDTTEWLSLSRGCQNQKIISENEWGISPDTLHNACNCTLDRCLTALPEFCRIRWTLTTLPLLKQSFSGAALWPILQFGIKLGWLGLHVSLGPSTSLASSYPWLGPVTISSRFSALVLLLAISNGKVWKRTRVEINASLYLRLSGFFNVSWMTYALKNA